VVTFRRTAAAGLIGLWPLAVGLTLLTSKIGQAETAAPAVPQAQVFYSRIEPLTDTMLRAQGDPRPATADGALQLADWLVYSSLATGAAFDNNVNATPTNQIAGYGPRFQPTIIAERNTGLQRTLLYGVGDIRYYPVVNRTEFMDTTGGLVHVWDIQRDFIFRTQGQATRGENAIGLTDIGNGLIVINPVQSTRLFGSTSLEKGFGSFFTAMGGSVTHESFDDTKTLAGIPVSEGYRDGYVATFNGRLGYHVSPLVYTFIEPSANWARYVSANLDSQGYRTIAGVGSDRIGLMNGELYAGYMTQNFVDPTIDSLSRGVFGGRLSWYPTRFLTMTASLDQGLSNSDFTTRTFVPGSVTKTNTAKFVSTWEMTRSVTLGGTIEYRHLEYLSMLRKDDLWRASADLTYWFTPRFGMTLDYSHVFLQSNLPGADYSRDFISLSGKSKF
jgi:hypothetical protein